MFFIFDWIAKLLYGEDAVKRSRERRIPRRRR